MAQPTIDQARAAAAEGRWRDAEAMARAMAGAAPGAPEPLEILAMAQQRRGDAPGAEATLRRAIAVAPDRRWPYDDLGRLLIAGGRAAEAEAVARAAVAADAANPDARAMLGTLLAERGALAPAARHLGCAIESAGRHPQLLAGLGRVLARQGRLDEARALLAEAVAADPRAHVPLLHLSEVEEQRGALAEAARLLDRAEPLAARAGSDILLQRAVLLSRTEDWRGGLKLLDAQGTLSGAALLQRARLRDRAGRYGEAWADAVAGKAALARGRGAAYPAETVARELKALAAFFTPGRTTALPAAPRRGGVPQPIFVLGFPRSGTTLVEQILASHSRIRAGGELPFGRAVRDMAARIAGDRFPAALADAPGDWPERLRDLYLAGADDYGLLAPGADFFTDKMPLNEAHAPLLRLAFPQAPMIRVVRHPLDTLVSVMMHDMTHGADCAYRIEDAARHLAAIDAFAARCGAGALPLSYEALVADQRGETERLTAHLGLAVEPAQLAFHRNPRFAPTPSYAQVREPLNDRSVGRWRHYAKQLAPAMPIVADATARRGYSA